MTKRGGSLRLARGGLLYERSDASAVKIKTGRKVWRWPDPIDADERASVLKAFAERLRNRFPPGSGSNAIATITLSTGTFDFDTVERAFMASGWVCVILGSLAKLDHQTTQPNFRGGDLPLLWNVFDLHRIAHLNRIAQADGDEWSVLGSYSGRRLIRISEGEIVHGRRQWILGPAVDFFHDIFLPSLYGCDMARIRECPICSRPFFALRVDAGACSPLCLNAHRQREGRRRWKESGGVYEKHRKRNRLAKKTAAARRGR